METGRHVARKVFFAYGRARTTPKNQTRRGSVWRKNTAMSSWSLSSA